MTSFLLFALLALVAPPAQAAHLKCDLKENKIVTASFTRSISVDGLPDSFKFTQKLSGKHYLAQVDWNEKIGFFHLHRKGNSSSVDEDRVWDQPFVDYMGVTMDKAAVECVIDISDGESYRWKFYRSLLGINQEGIVSVLGSLRNMANIVPANPKEEAELNNTLCLEIGGLQDAGMVHDFYMTLYSFFDRHPAMDLFPKAPDQYTLLAQKVRELENFCTGAAHDPDQISFQDRKALGARMAEIQQIVNDTVAYIDERFPNKARTGLLP